MLIINNNLHAENDNNSSLHSLVINVVKDLVLNKTPMEIVAIIVARRKAVRKDKIVHKGVHESQKAQDFL